MSDSCLFYIYDPMCSWCYAFENSWHRLQNRLPEHIQVTYVLGGLAPDTDEPMPETMRAMIRQTWRKIEETVPGVHFNDDFWINNIPVRSTYPACRAILAARKQRDIAEVEMRQAIQKAYYQKALNPSRYETLTQCAHEIGLDTALFAADLVSADVQAALENELETASMLDVFSFPSLRFQYQGKLYAINVDYRDDEKMRNEIQVIMANMRFSTR
ncbi:MAG: DsbA family protein [Nitrosomonas sp.]|nr:DsbA family protein [Nitrosomonas sp.]MCW5607819.1 DsbA family protein [Nitrosomonas sp.]